jgi:predicted ATPase
LSDARPVAATAAVVPDAAARVGPGPLSVIIATRSPILLGYPDAGIYQASERGLERVEYEDTEHFQVPRNFLNRRQTFLKVLLAPDENKNQDDDDDFEA